MGHILKTDITIKDAEKIVISNKLENIDEPRYTILKNFKNSLDFNRSNIADTYSELDTSVVIHLSKLILSQWRETWEANYRNFSDKIDDRWDTFVRFRDPNLLVQHIPQEIDNLVEWYKFSIPTITPIVRIAVLFYRFIEISPFIAGNKFILIALLDYLLLKNGFSSKSYSSLTRVIDLHEEKFSKTFEVIKKTYDLSLWIDAFAQTMLEELTLVREEIEKFIVLEEKAKAQPFLNLNKRQLKVLKYLQKVPIIKREDYCHMMEVSTMTAFRDLNDLVRKKLVKVEGKGRGTIYKLSTMV
jgi:Fic family protein